MKQDITEFTQTFSYVNMVRLEDRSVEMRITGIDTASAEIALNELKLIKHFLKGRKVELRSELKDIRQARATEQANQIVMPRGGGKMGLFARFGLAMHRSSKRSTHDANIKPYEDALQHLDQLALGVDSATLHIKTAMKANA